MVLQAVIDDSYTAGDVFVLAGYIADSTTWKTFSCEWESLLKSYGTLDMSTGLYHFKMAEMASNPDRLKRVSAFYRVIEEHVLCSISIAYNRKDLEKAKRRIFIPHLKIDWGYLNYSYLFAFRGLMDMFHSKREEMRVFLPPEDTVNFIFDRQNNEEIIYHSFIPGHF